MSRFNFNSHHEKRALLERRHERFEMLGNFIAVIVIILMSALYSFIEDVGIMDFKSKVIVVISIISAVSLAVYLHIRREKKIVEEIMKTEVNKVEV